MIHSRDEREVAESPKVQGVHERRAYSFDFSASGVSTIEGTPSVTLYDWSAGMHDVSASMLSGTDAPASGQVATMSGTVQDLADGTEYLLFCRVTHDGGQISELICRILARA
jgi:hypothetical protein